MDFNLPNNLGIPMPGIYSLSRVAAHTMRKQAMYAFALMHVKDVIDGDIEILQKKSLGNRYVSVQSMPLTFDEFFQNFTDAEAFHCRVKIAMDGKPQGKELALISKGYDFPYDMLLGEDVLLFHGGYSWTRTEVIKFLSSEVKPLVAILQEGKELPVKVFVNPPIDELQNHGEFRSAHADANGRIHVQERSEADETMNYLCFRPMFQYFCTDDIPCCGACPITKKAYDILINEALDEESAARLSTRIEKSGLFATKNANGTWSCEYLGQCANECKSHDAFVAEQEIRRYWYECFQ